MQFERFDPGALELASRVDVGLPGFLGVRTVGVEPGALTAEVEVDVSLFNEHGSAHGAVLAALTDHVLGAVAYPVAPRGCWVATTQLNLNFIAPVREGVLRAHAEIVAMGRRNAVVRVSAHNQGRLVGAAQGSVTIVEPPAAPRRSRPDRPAAER